MGSLSQGLREERVKGKPMLTTRYIYIIISNIIIMQACINKLCCTYSHLSVTSTTSPFSGLHSEE